MYQAQIKKCRHITNFKKINRISEGAYGIVYKGEDLNTGEIVALKRLKLEKETQGFPITSLREIHALLLLDHPHIVNIKEIVIGNRLDDVYIVMEFIEHELKHLLNKMPSKFLQSEVKTIMLQILSAIDFLHDNWIIHRDLKTSNLLLNNKGEIKVADFGLARKYGSPLGDMTQLVVTLWYRSPELLLGAKTYTTAVDIWSVGCIFGELIDHKPLFPGQGEIDQLNKIFKVLGTPNSKIWPDFDNLPVPKSVKFHSYGYDLPSKFPHLTRNGIDLLERMLTYDPEQRITAKEALNHPYFKEAPLPKDPSMFPTWPSKAPNDDY